jgi:hypothetical protein
VTDLEKAGEILERARQAAIEYYELTGKPLGITGEIGEYLAAKMLDLRLADARAPGYDATDDKGRRIQIKTRCIPRDRKMNGQRLGSIRFEHHWDSVLLVLLDERLEPLAILEANRTPLEEALMKPGSKARNERGALSVSKFKSIGTLVWEAKEASPRQMHARPFAARSAESSLEPEGSSS